MEELWNFSVNLKVKSHHHFKPGYFTSDVHIQQSNSKQTIQENDQRENLVLVFYFTDIRHSVQYESTEVHSLILPLLGRFFLLLKVTQYKVSFKYILLIKQHQRNRNSRRRGFKKKHSYLVSSTDQIQIMTIQKFTDHISTKSERDPTIIFTPTLHIFVWVRPQQVTQQAFER